ncbi:MAG: DUF5050 domain-containing protein [bacterium]
MNNLTKRYLFLILIFLSSCSENTIINDGNTNSSKDIFYLKFLQAGQFFSLETYSITSDGTNNKLFIDSLFVTSTSYYGKVTLGRIAGGFFYYEKLYVINTDGTNMIQIPRNDLFPVYFILSPRGDKVLFTTAQGNYLCVINSDGTNFLQLSDRNSGEIIPQFSPDGNSIAFMEFIPSVSKGLHVINTDGTNKTLVKDSISKSYGATLDWSPDGNKIVFENNDPFPTRICTINKDGSGYTILTEGTNPSWSPDGSKICFLNYINQATELLLMNADGSNQKNISNTNLQYENSPRWSPDSKQILFSYQQNSNDLKLKIYDLISMETRLLADSATSGFWTYYK